MNQFFNFNKQNLINYRLTIEVGERASLHGQTWVHLTGSGELEARLIFDRKDNNKSKEPVQVKGKFSDTEEVFRKLANFDWQKKFPTRPGIPDEAIIVWKVELESNTIAILKMWLGEAEKDERVYPVLQKLRRSVETLSNNLIYI